MKKMGRSVLLSIESTRKAARAELYGTWMGAYSSSHCRELRLGAGMLEAQEDGRVVGNQDLFVGIKGSHPWICCQVHIGNFVFCGLATCDSVMSPLRLQRPI